MGFKDLYFYTFYKIYKVFEGLGTSAWLIKSRSRGLFLVLQCSFIWQFYLYYKIISKQKGNDGAIFFLILSIGVILINTQALFSDERIKLYADKFNEWPKEKIGRLNSIIFMTMALVLFSFILSAVLYARESHGSMAK